MNIENKNYTECSRCISWTAVIVGGLIAVGLSFLFHLLSTGFGLSAFSSPSAAFVMGALIWLVLGSYLILFLAGYITGRIASPVCNTGLQSAIHGFLAWTLAIIIMVGFSHMQTDSVLPAVKYNMNQAAEQYMQSSRLEVSVNQRTENAINKIGVATLAVFFVFFAGALGSTMGAYFAVSYHSLYPTRRKLY